MTRDGGFYCSQIHRECEERVVPNALTEHRKKLEQEKKLKKGFLDGKGEELRVYS